MAAKRIIHVYCDACFFIAIFNEEKDRVDICQAILEDAKAGKIEIYVSYATIIECCHPPNGKTFREEDVERFFLNEYFIKIEVDKMIAFKGRKIQQELKDLGVKKVKPFDALHLASALSEECEYLFTYDRNHLISLQDRGIYPQIKICNPERPWDTQMKMPYKEEP